MKEGRGFLRRPHQDREDLIGEHALSDIGQLIFLVIFFSVWIADSFVFKFSTFLTQYISNYIRIPISVIAFIIAGYLAQKGMNTVFAEKRESPQVITNGVFSIVRHPIYLAAMLLYSGFIFLSLSLLSILVWIFIIVFYYQISRYEERLLIKKFGSAYIDYMKKVPMFFPIKRIKGQ